MLSRPLRAPELNHTAYVPAPFAFGALPCLALALARSRHIEHPGPGATTRPQLGIPLSSCAGLVPLSLAVTMDDATPRPVDYDELAAECTPGAGFQLGGSRL